MQYDYYYNNIPGIGQCRNNLIYTSLISADKKTFVQWYYNDGEYHKGQNEVVNPELMENKWNREKKYLSLMSMHFPEKIPDILDINDLERKIYLKIDGVDLWQRSLDNSCSFDIILPDWQNQIIDIIKCHKSLQIYKYSMHPSSYFLINGELKSINYFFAYHQSEGPISIADHTSHIYSSRQAELKKYTDYLGIDWHTPQPLALLEQLCWESFRTNYPVDFIEKVKCIK